MSTGETALDMYCQNMKANGISTSLLLWKDDGTRLVASSGEYSAVDCEISYLSAQKQLPLINPYPLHGYDGCMLVYDISNFSKLEMSDITLADSISVLRTYCMLRSLDSPLFDYRKVLFSPKKLYFIPDKNMTGKNFFFLYLPLDIKAPASSLSLNDEIYFAGGIPINIKNGPFEFTEEKQNLISEALKKGRLALCDDKNEYIKFGEDQLEDIAGFLEIAVIKLMETGEIGNEMAAGWLSSLYKDFPKFSNICSALYSKINDENMNSNISSEYSKKNAKSGTEYCPVSNTEITESKAFEKVSGEAGPATSKRKGFFSIIQKLKAYDADNKGNGKNLNQLELISPNRPVVPSQLKNSARREKKYIDKKRPGIYISASALPLLLAGGFSSLKNFVPVSAKISAILLFSAASVLVSVFLLFSAASPFKIKETRLRSERGKEKLKNCRKIECEKIGINFLQSSGKYTDFEKLNLKSKRKMLKPAFLYTRNDLNNTELTDECRLSLKKPECSILESEFSIGANPFVCDHSAAYIGEPDCVCKILRSEGENLLVRVSEHEKIKINAIEVKDKAMLPKHCLISLGPVMKEFVQE